MTLDTFLGTGTDTGDPTMFFDVHETDGGEVVLVTDYEWKSPSLEACLRQLTSVINEYAVWTHSCAALHSGAVRSPEGDIVLLPAPSGNGKSTLTGAFVAAGWDYLGDEAVGVRPGSMVAVGYPKRLAIDASSRAVLNLPESDSDDLDPAEINPGVNRLDGDVGQVNRVVLPTYLEGAEPSLQRLEPHEAVGRVAGQHPQPGSGRPGGVGRRLRAGHLRSGRPLGARRCPPGSGLRRGTQFPVRPARSMTAHATSIGRSDSVATFPAAWR